MIPNWVPFFGGTSDTSEPSTGESDESSVEYDGAQTPLDSLADSHQSLVAPENVVERASGVEMGERWRQTLWVAEYPDEPIDGLFETLYSTGETRETDISIHLDPRDTHSTLNEPRIESRAWKQTTSTSPRNTGLGHAAFGKISRIIRRCI